jgi:uridine kinase
MRLPITPVTTLQRALREDVRRRHPGGRVVIAVDGVDGAGQDAFADGLAAVFAEDGSAVFRARMDDFHRPRALRYLRGRDDPAGFYLDSFDYATFRRVLTDPFLGGRETSAATGFQLAAFDVHRDAPIESRWVTGPADAVLIVDGIFLHRPELRDIWTWTAWLEVPAEIAFARMAERFDTDPEPDAASNRRYRLGQQIYLRQSDPTAHASAIVDNADPAAPTRVGRDRG